MNNKILEALKLITTYDNPSFSEISVNIEIENMYATPEEKLSIAELQISTYYTIPTLV